MNHIPYKGSAPAINDLVGGQIQVLFDPFSTLYPQVAAGKVRALAVTTEKRSSVAPDLPTLAEAGYPGFDVSSWQGIVVPAGTPRDAVERLRAETVAATADPDLRARFAQMGVEPMDMTADQLTPYVRVEYERWGQVIRAAGIKSE